MRLRGPFAKMAGCSQREKYPIDALISPPQGNNGRPGNCVFCKNVKFVHQRHVNMCGGVCLNMLFAYKGKPHEDKLRKNPRGIFEGLDTDQVKQKLMDADLLPSRIQYPENQKWSAEGLASILNEYGPVICKGKLHFVLVFGADQDNVIYHDPWSGPNQKMSLDKFNKFLDWKDSNFIIGADDPLANQNEVTRPTTPEAGRSTADRLFLRLAQQNSRIRRDVT